jgi:hypothetical protein
MRGAALLADGQIDFKESLLHPACTITYPAGAFLRFWRN